MNRKKITHNRDLVSSISQIRDPDATGKWMDLYVNLLKKAADC
ncbi:hypothetical protein [Paenibacillus illinoisensis]|nr:hypothetical protein [Paenibacillus illinoisensis]